MLTPFLKAALSWSVGVLLLTACRAGERDHARVNPVYDAKTGRLTELTYDANGNGRVDTWTYMDGTRLLRAEIDADEDGRIDRWEYYRPDRKLEKVGFSRMKDGKVDAWAFQGPDGTLARIDVSTRRDGAISRVEFYEKGAVARVEEDTDGDGKADKWETYLEGTLASLALDTERRGFPDRRLLYRPDGTLDHIETDPEGDGTFSPVRGTR